MTRAQRDGILFIVLAAVAYALLPILAKIIYADPTLDPLDVLSWRFAFAAPAVWLAVAVMRPAPPPPDFSRLKMMGMGVLFLCIAGCAFFALQTVPASLYTALLYTYPAMVAVLSAMLGERLPIRGWVALALTIIGVLLTIPPENAAAVAPTPLAGVIFCLFNAFLYAIYLVISGRLLKGQGGAASHTSLWSITGAFVALVLIAPLHGITVPSLPQAWAGLAALGVISTVVPSFAMLAGIARLGAARASILSTSEPILTVILALLLLPNESMTWLQLLGGVLIIISVIVLELRPSSPQTT